MSEEVGCEDFLQTVGGEPVLLRQDPLAGRKHADDAAAVGTTQTREGGGWQNIKKKIKKSSNVPGEEAAEKGFHIKMWVWHDAGVQVETVQPVVPAAGKQPLVIFSEAEH